MKHLLLITVLLAACGSGTPTLREVCLETGEAWCSRAIECYPQDISSPAACVTSFVKGCCLDKGRCDERARSDYNLDLCVDQTRTMTCDDLAAGGVPRGCLQ